MDNLNIERLRRQVKEALKSDKMRFRHTIGVADTCACLAMRYNIDMERSYIAGLLHDCAKCIPDEMKVLQCRNYHIELTPIEEENQYLIHSKLGAFYAKKLYGIEDDEICNAIKYHTTGHAGMTRLEEIVFLSDYIEPYRNTASDLNRIRGLAFVDIDMAVYEVLRDTLDYLKLKSNPIDKTTVEAFNYYHKLILDRK